MTREELFYKLLDLKDIFDVDKQFKLNNNNNNIDPDTYWYNKYDVPEIFINLTRALFLYLQNENDQYLNFDYNQFIDMFLILFRKEYETDEEVFDRLYHTIYYIYESEHMRIGYLTWKEFSKKLIDLTKDYDFSKSFKIEKISENEIYDKYKIRLGLNIKDFRKLIYNYARKKYEFIPNSNENNYQFSEFWIDNENDKNISQNIYDRSYKAIQKLMQINNKLEK